MATLVPPPLTFVAAAAAASVTATTTTATSPTTSAPPASAQSGPAPQAAVLRLSGNDNGTAIVVGLTLAAVALLFAFLAARKFRQERRIRETVRMQQLLAQHQQAMHTGAAGGGGGGSERGESLRSNDDTRSTITENVRREMAGTASNTSTTVSPGRPLGGVRRGRSKTMRTPSLTSQRTLTLPTPAASHTTTADRGSLSFSSQFGDLL